MGDFRHRLGQQARGIKMPRGRQQIMRFEITQSDADKKYRFRIWSSSDILASSQGYVAKQSAEKAIASIMANASTATVVDNT